MSKTATKVDLLALADVASAALVDHLQGIGTDLGSGTWQWYVDQIGVAFRTADTISSIRFHGGGEGPAPEDIDLLREVVANYHGWASEMNDEDPERPAAMREFWRAEDARISAVVASMGWEAT